MAALLARFAGAAAPPDPADDLVAALRAWLGGEPPLLELRRRRGLRREAVVDALVRSLALDPAKRDRVAGYYHRLETGQLAPERVDRRVFAALAGALRARVEDLLPWPAPPPPPPPPNLPARGGPPPPAPAYFRAAGEPPAEEQAALPLPLPPQPGPAEPDEIDRLFTGGH